MGMKTFTADRRKSVCHVEEGQDTRASKTQKGSINNESKGRETNDESRRAARCKGTPLRSNAAHCLLGSDQEPFMRWRNGEYQTKDEAVLHGELVGGNSTQRLKVVVRIRPAENASAARMVTVLPDGKTVCLVPEPAKIGCKEQLDQRWPRKSKRELRATFDRVLGESADQSEVYDQVRACVRYSFLGVNSCVLAYGQTGSGKTYTMMGDAWKQDSRARWARSTSQGDSGIFSESKLLVKPDGGDEQSTQSATRDTRQKHGIVSMEREGVIPRVVREIFSLSQRLFEASTSASRTPLSPLLGKENIIQDVETQRATSSSTCSPPVSWGTDGDRGGGDKSKNTSIDSFGVRVNERSLTRRLFIEQSECLDLRQQCKEGKRRGNSATDVGSSKRVQENDRSTSPSPSCMVECSYIQIYNDHVYDLLSNEIEQKPLSILDSASNVIAGTTAAHKDFPTGERGAARQGSRYRHCVVGLSVHHVENAEQTLRLLQRGAGNRRVRSTQMNINSSRSHCIVQFTISSTTTKNIRETLSGAGKPGTPDFTRLPHKSDREPDPGSEASTSDLETAMTTRATLSLVDLAGSERGGIDSEDMGAEELERKRINASLSALSNCIFRLGESGRTHVPYRDSSLTRLLRGSLEGGKTVLIATISPMVDFQAESINTLQFAARCTRVIMKQCVNEVVSDALLLKRARSQISYLRRRLRQLENTSSAPAISGSMTTVFACDGKAEGAVRYQKGKQSVGRSSDGEFEQKRHFHYSEELDRGTKLGSDDLGLCWGFQSAIGTSKGQLHRVATGKYNRNNEAPNLANKNTLDDVRRDRDLLIHNRSPPDSRGQHSVNLKADSTSGDCTTLGRAISSKGWKPRTVRSRSQRYSPPVETDDSGGVAMVALIERFSSREGELLREIESWKAKCERGERNSRGRDCHATNALNCWSGGKRSASSAAPARLSQRVRAIKSDLAYKGRRPGRESDAASWTVTAQTIPPRGGERSAPPRRQQSKDTQRERVAVANGLLQRQKSKVRGQRAKGGDPTGLFHESNHKKCTRVGDANEVPVNAIFPIVGHHLSCAELRTTSNSITEGNGSGGFSLKQGELDNDNEIREDVDEHMSSGRIVGKMDCFVETAIKTAGLANDRVVPGGGTPRIIPRSNLASSSPYDATSIHVLSVKEDYLPPRKCSGQEWPSLTEASTGTRYRGQQYPIISTIQGTTVSNHLHDTETCRGEKKTFSGSLLKRGIAKGERNTEIPNAGGSSHAPAHGVWPATDGRSQPTNVVIDPTTDGRENTCRRHGLSSCILCDDFSLHLDRKSSPLNAPQGGESTKPKGGVTVAACAPTGFLGPTGDGNCTTCSLEEHRLSTAGAAVISREEECMPCLPHLLPNCVLCKMQNVRLGRSTSLSALGPTHSGASKTDTPEPSHLRTSKPIARRNDHCEQHDLSDCLPSDNQGSMASVSNSHHRGGRGSIEPLLPGHSPSVFPPRQDLRPSTPPRQIKIFPDHTNHDTSVIAKAGAESAEGPTTVVARNSDDNEDVVTPHRRSRFPPAALRPRRSGISRGMRDNNPAPGDHYACYGRTIGKRHAGDAYAGRNRGERRNHRGNNSLARSRQSSSTNASSRRTGGGRTGAGNSGVRLRESNRDVSDFVTRALMAARAVL